MMSNIRFFIYGVALAAVFAAGTLLLDSEYFFYAGYVVLQYVVLATAWNILGGYAGYVNFGTAAFFAIGAYATAAIYKTVELPVPAFILIAGAVCGIVGLAVGYLTLRLKGVYFSIATLALSVVVQTVVTNWEYVGGSRGIYLISQDEPGLFGGLVPYLFMNMLALAVVTVTIARAIENSDFGYGLTAIKDDESAAEAAGVPTLRMKLIATTLSGAFMGMAGAPLPFYMTFIDPASSFNLAYTVNSVAMPIIGGMASWFGPVIGAIVLATAQQVATVTISSAANLLIVGILLVGFVVLAPKGILGLLEHLKFGGRRDEDVDASAFDVPSLRADKVGEK
jgi:branched-chain amino acid transport system permease protein